VIIQEIELRTGSTWYRVLGDWPFWILALAALALSRAATLRRRSAAAPTTVAAPATQHTTASAD